MAGRLICSLSLPPAPPSMTSIFSGSLSRMSKPVKEMVSRRREPEVVVEPLVSESV
ncbi:hypothetical protein D9M71_770100 [compost metagenome]